MGRGYNAGVLKHDSESAAVLHKYKHVAGNPLKLNTPVLTYLNEVDKHTANYACSGFGEKSAASFPTTKTWVALQIKALSGSTRPCREEFWVCFFLMVCQVERQMAVSEVLRFYDTPLCDRAWPAVSIISLPHISLNLSDPDCSSNTGFLPMWLFFTPLPPWNYMKRILLSVAARSPFSLHMLIISSLP